jgi:hypothetical protein
MRYGGLPFITLRAKKNGAPFGTPLIFSLATTYFPDDVIPVSIIGPRGLTTVVGMGTGVSPWASGHQTGKLIAGGAPAVKANQSSMIDTGFSVFTS